MSVSKTSPSMLQIHRDLSGNQGATSGNRSLNDTVIRTKASRGSDSISGPVALSAIRGHISGFQRTVHDTWDERLAGNDKVYKSWYPQNSNISSPSVIYKNGKMELFATLRNTGFDQTVEVGLVGYLSESGYIDVKWKWESFGIKELSKGISEALCYQDGPLTGPSQRLWYVEDTKSTITTENTQTVSVSTSKPYFYLALRAFCPKEATTGAAAYNMGVRVWDIDARYR